MGDATSQRSRLPQVAQTSATDCGPAVLTSVLRGYGRAANLEATGDLYRHRMTAPAEAWHDYRGNDPFFASRPASDLAERVTVELEGITS